MNKLPQEFKEKWIAALRSGEYKQGRRNLYFNETYCCLGVACEIAGIDRGRFSGRSWIDDDVDTEGKVPTAIKGRGSRSQAAYKLSGMNDTNTPFSVISDYIEQNL